MKLLRPYYFDEFKCTGGACKDSCCIGGWDILVDEESAKAYKRVDGEFGETLRNSVVFGDVNKIKLDKNKCCPLVNKEGLCDVYINLGEEKMPMVCKQYPRMFRQFNDILEYDVSLSCPEVAAVLVKSNSSIDFLIDDMPDENKAIIDADKLQLLNGLTAGRGLSVDIMQMDNVPLWKRMFICIHIADKIQHQINTNAMDSLKEKIAMFQNDEYIMSLVQSLDTIEENISLKSYNYVSILGIVLKLKLSNEKFVSLLVETGNFVNNHMSDKFDDEFDQLMKKFDLANNSKIFENFNVYFLFHYYMNAYESYNINKSITCMVAAYSLIKMIAMVRWYNNGFTISDDEWTDILYLYSRDIEHGKNLMNELHEQMKEKDLDNVAHLISLII